MMRGRKGGFGERERKREFLWDQENERVYRIFWGFLGKKLRGK